ncbi:flippase [Halalkalicoccus salilacus]|uniref:flippase n=1 Tax=Halalkalicoccus salilacus TaxID=3117459 RepID=UPI00300EBA8D
MALASELGKRFKIAFVAEIAGVLAGGIMVVSLARLLDPDSYGLLFLAISIFSVARLFSVFGIPRSASRYLSEFKETDRGQVPHILRISLIMNFLSVGVVTAVLVFGNKIISEFIGVPELSSFLSLGGFYIISATITTYVRLTLQGLEKIEVASSFIALNQIGRSLFSIGFVLFGFGAVGALFGYILGYALTAILGTLYMYKNIYSKIDPSPIESGLKMKIARYSLPIAVTQSAHSLDHEIDRVLVGFFVGPTGVGFYTLGKQVVQFIETPMTALGFTLSPTYNAQKTKGNTETAARIYESTLSNGLLLYIPAAAGVILLAGPGIDLLFGSDYRGAVPVLQILAIFAVLKSIVKVTSDGLDFLGRARERAYLKGGTALLNIILNIALIPILGVIGAALATVVTYSIYTFGNLVIMVNEIQFDYVKVLKNSGYATVITAVMSLIVFLTRGLISNIISLVGVIFLGVAVWMILVISTGMIDARRVIKLVE